MKLKLLICCLGTDSNTRTQQSAQPSNPESPSVVDHRNSELSVVDHRNSEFSVVDPRNSEFSVSENRNSQSAVIEPGMNHLPKVGAPEGVLNISYSF